MTRSLIPLSLLVSVGCGGSGTATETATEGPEMLHVMRDCQPEVGRICPWAGDGYNGFNGNGIDKLDAWFSYPMSVTFSPYGKPVIADWNNHELRLVEDDGTLTRIMGTDSLGDGDPNFADSTPAGAPGTTVNLNHPTMQEYFSDGTLLSDSWHTHKIRTWDPATGLVHVLVGSAPGYNGDETGVQDIEGALLNQPKEIKVTSDDNFYILDMRNERIRFVDLDAGTITNIAGNGEKGYCGDGGPALEACFGFPKNSNPEPGGAMALDEAGGLMYIADTENHVIRVLDLVNGTIDLLAGTPETTGDVDGFGADAMFNFPNDIELDGDTLFVSDANNHKIRAIDVTTGEVTTFAGTGEPTCAISGDVAIPQICDEQHSAGDGGPASEATLYRPMGVNIDLDGNLVISDTYNYRIRIVYR